MKKTNQTHTILEEETVFSGDLKYSSSLTIKGRFDGTIDTSGTLIVEKNARITAAITAANLVIAGSVTGDCLVSDKMEMLETASLHGNIKVKKLKMADGVDFEGKCEMIK